MASGLFSTWYHDQLNNYYSTATQTANTGFQGEIVRREAIVTLVGDELITSLIESGKTKEELQFYHGAIQFRFPSTSDGTTDSNNIAFRDNPNIFIIPVIGERVLITQISSGMYIYSFPANLDNNVNNNIVDGFDENVGTVSDSTTYTSARDGAFVNLGDNNIEGKSTFITQNITPLKYKEGDILIEGRQSNFIKLTSEDDNKNPMIVIGIKPVDQASTTLFTNNSTIMITSNNKVVIPDFKRNISSVDYTKYIFNGKQLIMMSDRVFLGSRSNQIFLMSNSHIHLAANDITSIDANTIVLNSEVCTVNSTVMIGKDSVKSPVTKADELKSILYDLITALASHTHGVTGAVTSQSANSNVFTSLLSRLNDIYSKDVFVS